MGDGAKAIAGLLSPIVATLTSVEDAMKAVTIHVPALKTKVIDIPVVGTIKIAIEPTIKQVHPLTGVANSIKDVRTKVASVGAAMVSVADGLAALRQHLPAIQKEVAESATDMDNAGASLALSGAAMEKAGQEMRKP